MSTMESFTPLASTIGGMMIGTAAAGLLLFHGRIAGISGIAGGIFRREAGDISWRVMFLIGLFAAGAGWSLFYPQDYVVEISRSMPALIVAGLTVGIGTQLGSGCTSGHGVCGIGRLSKRSTVATISFMITAALTVFVVNEVLGGSI
ncbi:MAG: YeeE/YedE family protein [Polyangiales bacterium]